MITKASVKLYPWYGPPEWKQTKQPGEFPSLGQLDAVPDGYKVFIPTFRNLDDTLEAAAEYCRAKILFALGIGIIGAEVPPEGNDEHWAMVKKLQNADLETQEAAGLFKKSVVLVIGGQSPRELEYKEKCILAITEKWDGQFLPQYNDPRSLARAFVDITWSMGVNLRATGDFLPSSSSPDGSPDMLKKLALQEAEVKDRYEKSGAFMPMGSAGDRMISWRPEEHLSIGAQGISTAMYDPYDPTSLKAAREFINELFDPRGSFNRFGVPSRGGDLQIEPVPHVHQNWGHLYDHYDVWVMKIKKMLDPNTVGDWTAYIPPEYPDYPKEGDYVLPSYGKEENDL